MYLSSNKNEVFVKWLKKILYNLYWQGQIELLLFFSQIEIIDKFCKAIFSSIELENQSCSK